MSDVWLLSEAQMRRMKPFFLAFSWGSSGR